MCIHVGATRHVCLTVFWMERLLFLVVSPAAVNQLPSQKYMIPRRMSGFQFQIYRTHTLQHASGVVIEGEMHVVHKGLSMVQVLEKPLRGWMVEDHDWPQGPMSVVDGSLYVMSHGFIYKQEKDKRKLVVSASEFRGKIGYAMTGLRGEIYVVGGVICPDLFNWDIKQTSDVDVLTIGGERPIWRRVAPMTQCRGTIRGCTQLRI
ncbi:F-box/kelch-repeat protein skip30 [Ancistrocladus abbreviatus]